MTTYTLLAAGFWPRHDTDLWPYVCMCYAQCLLAHCVCMHSVHVCCAPCLHLWPNTVHNVCVYKDIVCYLRPVFLCAMFVFVLHKCLCLFCIVFVVHSVSMHSVCVCYTQCLCLFCTVCVCSAQCLCLLCTLLLCTVFVFVLHNVCVCILFVFVLHSVCLFCTVCVFVLHSVCLADVTIDRHAR
jgi:hypothetical protein